MNKWEFSVIRFLRTIAASSNRKIRIRSPVWDDDGGAAAVAVAVAVAAAAADDDAVRIRCRIHSGYSDRTRKRSSLFRIGTKRRQTALWLEGKLCTPTRSSSTLVGRVFVAAQ